MIESAYVNQNLRIMSPVGGWESNEAVAGKTRENSFQTVFNAYLDLYNETNAFQLEAEKMELLTASGKIDDMVGLNLALQKASASLNFTIQVTNKVLNAYQEIMRMQI